MLESASNPDDCRWLPGARLNIAESALCVRDPDAPALLWAEEEAPEVPTQAPTAWGPPAHCVLSILPYRCSYHTGHTLTTQIG